MGIYYTDFNAYPSNAQPADWTKRWQTNSVHEVRGTDPNKYLYQEEPGTQFLHVALTWDAIGTATETDITVKMRAVDLGDPKYRDDAAFIVVRANADAEGYFCGLGEQSDSRVLIMWRHAGSGSRSSFGSFGFNWQVNTWYWVRYQLIGSEHKAKIWADGQTEPETWQLERTQTAFTDPGWVGVLGGRNKTNHYDIFDARTDADVFPTVELYGEIVCESKLDGFLDDPFLLERQVHGQLLIEQSDGSFIDVTDYLVSASVNLGDVASFDVRSTGTDGIVRDMQFVLHNENEDRFNPRDEDSPFNQLGSSYSPLLWPGREVQFSAAITPLGQTPVPADFRQLFRGLLGDNISGDGPRVNVAARDLGKRLQDAYFMEARQYGTPNGEAAEEIIQEILDDEFGVGVVELYYTESPGVLRTFETRYQSVWDILQEIVAQFGWFLGYKFWPGTQQIELVLERPPRERNIRDLDIDWRQHYFTRRLDLTDRDLRNEVGIVYRDINTQIRETVVVQDASSIAEFGRRSILLEENAVRLLTDESQAESLAGHVLHDLTQARGDVFQLELALNTKIDLFTMLAINDPKVLKQDLLFGVQSLRHRLDWGSNSFRTTVVAGRRITGGHNRWLNNQARPGSAKPIERGEVRVGGIDTDRISPRSVTDTDIIEVRDEGGTFTDSLSFVNIPDFDIQVDLVEPTLCLLFYSMSTEVRSKPDEYWAVGRVRMLVNGVEAEGTRRQPGLNAGPQPGFDTVSKESTESALFGLVLPAGSNSIVMQYAGGIEAVVPSVDGEITVFDRVLSALILRR